MEKKLIFDIISSENLNSNGTSIAGRNIVDIPAPKTQTVHDFDPKKLKDDRNPKYSEHKKSFQNQTDAKNARFQINELARRPLSIEQEEEIRIESEVNRRVTKKLDDLRKIELEASKKEGFEAGRLAARQEVLGNMKPVIEKFEALITDLEGSVSEIYKANEDLLMRMTYRIAKLVMLREVKEDREYIRRLVLQILERLGTRENIKIFVGQEAYSAAEQLKADLAQRLGSLNNISVEMDPDYEVGCRVETEFGEVDAKIELQIQNIAKALGASEEGK